MLGMPYRKRECLALRENHFTNKRQNSPVGVKINGLTDVIFAPRGLRISFLRLTLYFQLHYMAPILLSIRCTRTLDRKIERREYNIIKKSRFIKYKISDKIIKVFDLFINLKKYSKL